MFGINILLRVNCDVKRSGSHTQQNLRLPFTSLSLRNPLVSRVATIKRVMSQNYSALSSKGYFFLILSHCLDKISRFSIIHLPPLFCKGFVVKTTYTYVSNCTYMSSCEIFLLRSKFQVIKN